MHALLEALLDALLPRACAGCRVRLPGPGPLCAACAGCLERWPEGGCPLCQGLGAAARPCPSCLEARSPLDACVAEMVHQGEAARWMHRFKYAGSGLSALDPGPAAVVEAWVRRAGTRLPTGQRPGLLIPVPLHPSRIRERAAHPPASLARALGRAWRVPVAWGVLERTRPTPSQTGLSRAARRRNVAGAFRARPGRGLPPRVGIVDDVVTTGATLAEIARVLRRAGADSVVAICAARTPATRVSGEGLSRR